jgi:hypothetical protein
MNRVPMNVNLERFDLFATMLLRKFMKTKLIKPTPTKGS